MTQVTLTILPDQDWEDSDGPRRGMIVAIHKTEDEAHDYREAFEAMNAPDISVALDTFQAYNADSDPYKIGDIFPDLEQSLKDEELW